MGETQNRELTGYPSIDKPWLKYYSEEAIKSPLPECTMYEYMFRRNKERLDKTAINYFGRKISHRKLLKQVDICANALASYGVKSGDLVGICMLTMPEAVYLLYAVNKLGAVCNFLVLNATEQALHKQIAESRIIVTVDLALERIVCAAKNTNVTTIISVSATESAPFPIKQLSAMRRKTQMTPSEVTTWKTFLNHGKNTSAVVANSNAESVATICFTGGTTGESKGVIQLNKAGNALAFHYISLSHFHAGERFLDILPPFLSYGLYVGIHMPLCAQMEVVLCPDPSPDKFPALIKKYKPNHFAGGPLHVENMVCDKRIQKMNLSFMATAAYGGDKTTEEWVSMVNTFLKAHNAPNNLQIGYGMTETCGTFCTTTPEHNLMIPFVNNNVRILDVDTGTDLRCGQEGEICLSGPTVMKGYYKHDTKDDIIWKEDGVSWLHTGDLGYMTEDGHFVISGRIKRVSWARGTDGVIYRVYPMKIEEVISKCPMVHRCCVICKPDEKKGNLSVAFVVLTDDNKQEKAIFEIETLCKTELPETSRPAKYYIVETLPLTGAGKVDYRSLEKLAAEDDASISTMP